MKTYDWDNMNCAQIRTTALGLFELLKQAERERDEIQEERASVQAVHRRVVAERETALANLESSRRWETGLRNIVTRLHGPRHAFEISDIVDEVEALRDERDSAIKNHSELREYTNKLEQENNRHYDERDAALAKAEVAKRDMHDAELAANAAEKERDEWAKRAADEQLSHGELRAGIEALADEVENHRYADTETARSVAPKIRTLLTPPKAETALEWVAKMEADLTVGDLYWPTELAKLRKLLEKQQEKKT